MLCTLVGTHREILLAYVYMWSYHADSDRYTFIICLADCLLYHKSDCDPSGNLMSKLLHVHVHVCSLFYLLWRYPLFWHLQSFVTSFSAGLYKEYARENIVVQVGTVLYFCWVSTCTLCWLRVAYRIFSGGGKSRRWLTLYVFLYATLPCVY